MPNFIMTTARGLVQLKHDSVKSAGAVTSVLVVANVTD
jgi:hypothetical protein